jgi:hypothetical protein
MSQNIIAQVAIEFGQLIAVNTDIGRIARYASLAISFTPQRRKNEQQGTDNKDAGDNPK